MKTFVEQLAQYAAYHRDQRNIRTHIIGVPMIVMAVVVLLSRPEFNLLGISVTPALLLAIWVGMFYLRMDVRFALVMIAVFANMLWVGNWVASQSTLTWLVIGLGLFIVGWAIQFVGHYYEGRKPAFIDDLVGLFIGPLFVAAELAFACGFRLEVQSAIEARLSLRAANTQYGGS
jgi:uncharacterized membrane protein YGL010W